MVVVYGKMTDTPGRLSFLLFCRLILPGLFFQKLMNDEIKKLYYSFPELQETLKVNSNTLLLWVKKYRIPLKRGYRYRAVFAEDLPLLEMITDLHKRLLEKRNERRNKKNSRTNGMGRESNRYGRSDTDKLEKQRNITENRTPGWYSAVMASFPDTQSK